MPLPFQRLLKMPSTLYWATISLVTSVMKFEVVGPSAQVSHHSGMAPWRRLLPLASTAIQSGWAAYMAGWAACDRFAR